MKKNAEKVFQWLYVVTLCAFLFTAALMVAGQIVGVVFLSPTLVSGASNSLMQLCLILALAAGFFGYIVFNLRGCPGSDD